MLNHVKSKLKVEFWIGLGGGARKEGGDRDISGKGWIEMIGRGGRGNIA